jgi:CHAT domain-containing protein
MPISLATRADVTCPRCGASAETTDWVAIDLVERPDLRPYLAAGEWIASTCPRCRGEIPRTERLLVTRLAPVAPVLLGLSYERLDVGGDPVTESAELIEDVRGRMGADVREVPGPLLVLPFDVLALAAGRDLEADAENVDAAIAGVTAAVPALATNYALFLTTVRDSMFERRLGLALNNLLAVQSVGELAALFSEYPELATEQAHAEVAQWVEDADDDEERHVARSQLEMLERAAGGDFDGAWEAYRQAVLEMSVSYLTPRIASLFARLDEFEERRDWTGALAVAEELLEMGRITGGEHIEAPASLRAATALYEMPGAGRAERIERAVALLARVIEIYDSRADLNEPLARAHVLQNLGAALAERLHGDPLANQERAIALQREVLELITKEDDGGLWAMSQTNLGLSLLERANAQPRREFEWEEETADEAEAAADIEEAIEHFNAALEWRRFDRDPRDWAYTQINLGLAYSRRLRGEREENLRQSHDHYSEAARGFAAAGDDEHYAQALHNMSSDKLVLAGLETTSASARHELLTEAAEDARASLAARSLDDAPVDAGRASRQLGDCLRALDDRDGAIAAYRIALEGLTPEVAPRHARDTARALADLASEADNWPLAAEAWEVAAEGAAGAWESRATARGRVLELRENLNVFRWAAYALARVGRLERAVEVLELGRARQLANWVATDVIDLERLRVLDPELEQRFVALRAALERLERDQRTGDEPAVAEAAQLAEELATTTSQIRALPGFESFLRAPRFHDVAAAARSEDALAYLVTSPHGSIALVVTNGDDGAQVRLIEASALTSTDLFLLFMNPDLETETLNGYLIAHGQSDDALAEAIAAFSGTLGTELLKPLAAALAVTATTTVCLIPISLLGLLPLHALDWEENGCRHCLLDNYTVVFAPSAFVRSVCLDRASRSTGAGRAVVVGNPLPQTDPLPGAEFEAQLVVDALAVGELDLLVGTDATKENVLAALPSATHAHLACHGAASIFGQALEAAVSLAHDEPLLAREILELDGFRPRLVVASACETGVVQGYDAADEVLTLGAMFVAAGAAGVVSTLWSIEDFPTALLMSRFYEQLQEGLVGDPAGALRGAQLWLRSLTPDEEDRYLATRPVLRTQRGERRPTGAETATGAQDDGRLYADITTWCAFVFSGA